MHAPDPSPAPAPRRRRLRGLSGYAVVLAALGAIGAGYAALAPSGHAADPTETSATVQAGHQLFLQACASCHGLTAQGGNRAPSLIGVGAAAVDFQVGTGRMPLKERGVQADRNTPQFNEKQIQELAAYVGSLAPGPAIPSNVDSEYKKGSLSEGLQLFAADCAQCHQVAGAGGVLTYGKYAPTLYAATPKQMYEAMITGPENMPVFGDKILSPEKKLSIIKYLQYLHKEPNPGGAGIGRAGPVSEGLVAWLLGIGSLVGLTLWIGKRI